MPTISSVVQTPSSSLITPLTANYGLKTLVVGAISFNTVGAMTIVDAVAGKKTYIAKLLFVSSGATDISLLDGTSAFSGPMPFSANMGFAFDGDSTPLITSTNTAFRIDIKGAVTVAGSIIYWQE